MGANTHLGKSLVVPSTLSPFRFTGGFKCNSLKVKPFLPGDPSFACSYNTSVSVDYKDYYREICTLVVPGWTVEIISGPFSEEMLLEW